MMTNRVNVKSELKILPVSNHYALRRCNQYWFGISRETASDRYAWTVTDRDAVNAHPTPSVQCDCELCNYRSSEIMFGLVLYIWLIEAY